MGRWILLCLACLAAPAWAQDKPTPVPDRQLPAEVLAGVQLVEDRFATALAGDCDPERCYAQGCQYVAHTVVDRPSSTSLPGLGRVPGPKGGPKQVYLTDLTCGFAHERSVSRRDARRLAKRLESKLSKQWTRVKVEPERLDPVPDYLAEPPDLPEEPEPVPDAGVPVDAAVPPPPVPPEKPWDAGRELWSSLLPHFPWMLGLFLFTFAALLIIWALRRLGKASPEEQALLAQMLAADGQPDEPAEDEAEPEPEVDLDAERLSAQHAAWRERLARDDDEADEALRVLVVDLLRAGDRRTLAKAVMLFPEAFPKAFPIGGEFASAKFDLAEYLKHADPASLPSEGEFFDKLDRYALSAALTAHPDTELIRSLHGDFGAVALVEAVQRLPARHGALLFAVAPESMQREAVRQLDPRVLAAGVDQLFRSNRMDPAEVADLLAVLGALKAGQALPSTPDRGVSDRGSAFDAPGALSVMLPRLSPETRQALVQHALQRHNGHLPGWTRDTLYGEMLLRLPEESLRDLLLEVPLEPLAAWLRTQTEATASAVKQRAPSSLQAALGSVAAPPSEGALLALAQDARAALSAGVLKRLARSDTPFHSLLA